jgi:hypothetical protein
MCWLKDVSDHGATSLAGDEARGSGEPKDHLNVMQWHYCRTVTEILRLRLGTYG